MGHRLGFVLSLVSQMSQIEEKSLKWKGVKASNGLKVAQGVLLFDKALKSFSAKDLDYY